MKLSSSGGVVSLVNSETIRPDVTGTMRLSFISKTVRLVNVMNESLSLVASVRNFLISLRSKKLILTMRTVESSIELLPPVNVYAVKGMVSFWSVSSVSFSEDASTVSSKVRNICPVFMSKSNSTSIGSVESGSRESVLRAPFELIPMTGLPLISAMPPASIVM